MPIILNIDTATENATISIAQNEDVLYSLTNSNQKDHASFLQPGVKKLLSKTNLNISELNAVSVTGGPGSYTGLRVGMASAKGICYAAKIPLIAVSTLEVMAFSLIRHTANAAQYFFCPMIDAGRMEVFTALFDEHLHQIIAPCALILQAGSFSDQRKDKKIIFCGSGAQKFLALSDDPGLIAGKIVDPASALALLSLKRFNQNIFADLLSTEPVYLKQYYFVSRPK